MDASMDVNRARWDELVPIHARSRIYDLDGFRRGRITVGALERAELGEVRGRTLLHLQCHFGLDTLTFARLGAIPTGVDYSAPAIALARSLAGELELGARFVCSNVYHLPEVLDGTFERIYTSYGVLCWLPDLEAWARVIAHFLAPGGIFYLAELHPLALVFDDDDASLPLKVRYPYLPTGLPLRFEGDGSYADRAAHLEHRVTYEWPHSLGEVISVLAGVGLRIEFLHEFDHCIEQMLPQLVQSEDGLWRLPEGQPALPLCFTLRASKP